MRMYAKRIVMYGYWLIFSNNSLLNNTIQYMYKKVHKCMVAIYEYIYIYTSTPKNQNHLPNSRVTIVHEEYSLVALDWASRYGMIVVTDEEWLYPHPISIIHIYTISPKALFTYIQLANKHYSQIYNY